MRAGYWHHLSATWLCSSRFCFIPENCIIYQEWFESEGKTCPCDKLMLKSLTWWKTVWCHSDSFGVLMTLGDVWVCLGGCGGTVQSVPLFVLLYFSVLPISTYCRNGHWQWLYFSCAFSQQSHPIFGLLSLQLSTRYHAPQKLILFLIFPPIIAGLPCPVNFLLYSEVTQLPINVYILYSYIIMFHHKCKLLF